MGQVPHLPQYSLNIPYQRYCTLKYMTVTYFNAPVPNALYAVQTITLPGCPAILVCGWCPTKVQLSVAKLGNLHSINLLKTDHMDSLEELACILQVLYYNSP